MKVIITAITPKGVAACKEFLSLKKKANLMQRKMMNYSVEQIKDDPLTLEYRERITGNLPYYATMATALRNGILLVMKDLEAKETDISIEVS